MLELTTSVDMASADIANILSRLNYTTKPYVTQGTTLSTGLCAQQPTFLIIEMSFSTGEVIKPDEYLQNGKKTLRLSKSDFPN